MQKKDKDNEQELGISNLMGKDPVEETVVDEVDGSRHDMVVERALDHLMSTDNMDIKSNLKATQVIPYTRLMIFSTHYNVPIADKIVNQALRLNVSIEALSRKGMVDIVRSLPPSMPEMESPGTLEQFIHGNKVHK